jgi:hypothetical protein
MSRPRWWRMYKSCCRNPKWAELECGMVLEKAECGILTTRQTPRAAGENLVRDGVESELGIFKSPSFSRYNKMEWNGMVEVNV